MPAKKSKSERLPKHGSSKRQLLLEIIHGMDVYKEVVEKGLPFFTLDELKDIEAKYKDGITWAEIDEALAKKGVILKKATFRRYINDKLIAPSVGYRKNEKGREALFPPDIIAHINFIQYFFRVADDDAINVIIDTIPDIKITARQAIEDEFDSGATIYAATLNNMKSGGIFEDDVEEAIKSVLSLNEDKEFRDEVLSEYKAILNEFDRRFSRWERKLESKVMWFNEK